MGDVWCYCIDKEDTPNAMLSYCVFEKGLWNVGVATKGVALFLDVSLDKRSKKAQREYHAKQRRTWGELNLVTRSVPSGKTYNRKKEKQRIGKEFRNGFEADLFLQNYIFFA